MSVKLSLKSWEIASIILDYITKRGISPTIEEVRNRAGLKTRGAVYPHINNLKDQGIIASEFGESRTLVVLQPDVVKSEYKRLLEEKRNDYIFK